MSAEQIPDRPATPTFDADRMVDEMFLRQIRDLAREAGITRPLSDEDAQAVLDWFDGDPDPDYRPLPDDFDSPEYAAEIERRRNLDEPVLSAKTVSEQLLLRWGKVGG